MKLKVIFLFLSLFVTSVYSHDEITRINLTNIITAQEAVKKELYNHLIYQRITKGAAITGIAAALGWAGYKLLYAAPIAIAGPGYITADDVQLFRACMYSLVQKAQTEGSFIDGIPFVGWFKQQMMANMHTFLVGVTVAAMFNLMNNSLGPISRYINRLEGIADRTYSSLFHKNNLEWYITTHVDLVTIFNFIEYNAAQLEGRAIQLPTNPLLANVAITVNSPTEVSSHATEKMACHDLTGYWNLFVQHIEKVLGYMEYTISVHTNALEVERMRTIISRISAIVNEFAQLLETKLNTLEQSHIKQFLYAEVQTLRAQLGHEISSFSLIESLKKHDFLNPVKDTAA